MAPESSWYTSPGRRLSAVMSTDVSKAGKASKKMSQEQIVAGFNQLRQEQRAMASKIVEVEADVNEHK